MAGSEFLRILAEHIGDGIPEDCGAHAALMVEPFLGEVLAGRKTIESRFSKNRIAPFGRIQSGDVVFLKKSGGPFVGWFRAGEVLSFELDGEEDVERLRSQYNDRLCADDAFWTSKADSRYATLIFINDLYVFEAPIEIHAKNRQSWIVLRPRMDTDLNPEQSVPIS